MVVGDFNLVLEEGDKQGGTKVSRAKGSILRNFLHSTRGGGILALKMGNTLGIMGGKWVLGLELDWTGPLRALLGLHSLTTPEFEFFRIVGRITILLC